MSNYIKNKTVYVVTAVRFTFTDFAVIGVTTKLSKAEKLAKDYEEYRGGNKYFCDIHKMELNNTSVEDIQHSYVHKHEIDERFDS